MIVEIPLLFESAGLAAGPVIRTASSNKSISWNGCGIIITKVHHSIITLYRIRKE